MSWREKIVLALAAGVTLFGAAGAPSASAQAPKPNIVFILTDNLGWGELGVYGGGTALGAATPRIDKLAGEGLRLTNYNVEPQCTPSRSALMTGRLAIRSDPSRKKESVPELIEVVPID
jgi:arylsulfatase A-like enzyme